MSVSDGGKAMTARELARLLGVSQSAVSRAYTPGASISPDLRERILSAADRFGYRPNAIASILSRQRSNIVGLVVSDLRNPFYPKLFERLTRRLQERGQQTLVFNIAPGSDVKQQLAALRQFHVDALVIVSATVLSGLDLAWAAEGRRAILVNRVAPDAGLASVTCDNVGGPRAIADHFHALGHRRVAYVAGLTATHVGRERQSAFATRVAELGMTLSALVPGGRYAYEVGHAAAVGIARAGGVDAIFFANDIMALGGMDALREVAGLRIPEDVAVAGFDDIDMAAWPHYRLTTYRQPVDAIVERTMALLDGNDPPPGFVDVVPGELVVRNSTVREAAV
ncbi:LacI family DNA-binding transcriptional regulator [Prosthecomicrobium sp. N25]|uniref:LacI family DNA-binding transcriptional regulator n=1 Tax=Prosthecomicrobium sp. N25 TaxID=3129254 RepID=UPI0030769C0E